MANNSINLNAISFYNRYLILTKTYDKNISFPTDYVLLSFFGGDVGPSPDIWRYA